MKLTKAATLGLLFISALPLVAAQEVTIAQYFNDMIWAHAFLLLTFTVASLAGLYFLLSLSQRATKRQILLVFALLTIFLSIAVWSGGQLFYFTQHAESAAFLPRNQGESADAYFDRVTAAVIQRLGNETRFEWVLIDRYNSPSTDNPMSPFWFSAFTGLALSLVVVWLTTSRHFHVHWLLPAWIGYMLIFFDVRRFPIIFGLIVAGTLTLYVAFIMHSYLNVRFTPLLRIGGRINILRRLRLARPAQPTATVHVAFPPQAPLIPKLCRNCGEEVESFARFCHKCGAQVEATSP